MEDVVNLIKSEMKESTKKFNFLVVEEFGLIERDNDRQAEAVPNISKLHAFRIIGKQLGPVLIAPSRIRVKVVRRVISMFWKWKMTPKVNHPVTKSRTFMMKMMRDRQIKVEAMKPIVRMMMKIALHQGILCGVYLDVYGILQGYVH